MAKPNELLFGNASKTADYFCELFREHCDVTEDRYRLLVSLRTMAWAVKQLKRKKGCEKIRSVLADECLVNICYLLDVITKEYEKSN